MEEDKLKDYKKVGLEDYYKLDIDRIFSSNPEEIETLLEVIDSKILYYKEKSTVTSEDDDILESLIYWLSDYLPRKKPYAARINTIIDDVWACRDRYLNDNLTYDPKKGY